VESNSDEDDGINLLDIMKNIPRVPGMPNEEESEE